MILLRHGQSEFNLHFTATRKDPGIADAKLTPLGHQQAEAAAEQLAGEGITRIFASPYTRALQTAVPIALRLGLPVLVNPAVRERFGFTCDVGSPVSVLGPAWPGCDFSHMEEVWWPQAEEPANQVEARAASFRAEMAASPDWKNTLVVCHWGFIMSLTGVSMQNGTWMRVDPTAPGPDTISWKV